MSKRSIEGVGGRHDRPGELLCAVSKDVMCDTHVWKAKPHLPTPNGSRHGSLTSIAPTNNRHPLVVYRSYSYSKDVDQWFNPIHLQLELCPNQPSTTIPLNTSSTLVVSNLKRWAIEQFSNGATKRPFSHKCGVSSTTGASSKFQSLNRQSHLTVE